jgi:PAS domain S-box-containing protein
MQPIDAPADATALSPGPTPSGAPSPFDGRSEMARRSAAFDWAATPLGAVTDWPAPLRTAVQLMLASGFPTVVLWGPELVMLYNDAYAALIGGRHPTALGMPTHDCWPETREFHEEVYARVFAGETVHLEDALLRTTRFGEPDDGYFTLDYLPIRDARGVVAGVQVVLMETTERVHARRLAAERERLLASLDHERRRLADVFQQAPSFFVVLRGDDLVFERANAAYREIVGGRAIEGRPMLDVLPEVRGFGFDTLVREVMRTRQPYVGREVEAVRIRPDSGQAEPIFVNFVYQPLVEADGICEAVAVHGFDVTAEVRARREIEAIYDSAPIGLCVLDRDLRYVRINERLAEINGVSVADHLGRTVREVVPGIADAVEAIARRIIETGEPALDLEITGETPAHPGVTRAWIEQWIPLRDEESRVTGINIVAEEVTEQRRAAAERECLLAAERAARAEAEAANRAKSEFLAVMSHELRTPLNAIGGYAELIELGIHGPVTEEQRTALARIQHSQRHLLGLINGVLNYSRIEAGAIRYQITDVAVAEVVNEAHALVAPQFQARGLVFTWSGCAPETRVRADHEKLRQVLLNLLGNAAKFTHPRDGEQGHVTVSCDLSPAGAPRGCLRLQVRDTGEGIAADKLAAVFEPFVQGDQRLTRTSEGVGLGLAISRDLARGMGGDLTVESTLGVGSTFSLDLPAA